jgi:hypothetical protein
VLVVALGAALIPTIRASRHKRAVVTSAEEVQQKRDVFADSRAEESMV